MRKFLFLLIFLFGSLTSKAQQPAYFMFAQEQFEGIDIYSVIQDFDHNYWFATDQGIYLHDGYTFKKIESSEMRSNSVFNFVINSKGVIYCSNLNQQVFQLKNGKCELVFNIPDKGSDINLLINQQDELYVSTSIKAYVLNTSNKLIHAIKTVHNQLIGPPFLLENGEILQHYSNIDKLVVYRNGRSRTEELKNFKSNSQHDDICSFYRLGGKSFAVNRLVNKVYSFDETEFSLQQEILLSHITKAQLTRYYTTSNNLWIVNAVSGVVVSDNQMAPSFNSTILFTDYFISHVFEDHEGNILLSTFDQGIIVIPNLKNLDVDATFNGISVNRMISNPQHGVFIGTREGGVFNFKNDLKMLSPNSDKGVATLFYWSEKNMLLDDTKNLRLHNFNTNTVSSLSLGSLKDAVSISDHEVLMAFNVGVFLASYDPTHATFVKTDTLSYERGYAVHFEKTSNFIYFSTSSGLYTSNNRGAKKQLLHQNKPITALDIEGYAGSTYVATTKQGLFVYKLGKLQHHFLPTFNGEKLSIFKLKIYAHKIYANTQIGLVVMGLDGKNIHHLNKSVGLTTNKIVDFEIYNNELWIGHLHGVQRINLSNLKRVHDQPHIQLKQLRVNNKTSALNVVNFDPNSRRFEFELSVYTLKNREDIKYWYKLIGADEEWSVNPYEDNKILYNALGSGHYTLLLKAENNGVFSKTIRYSFTIATPFYRQWWFWSIIALLGVGIITLIYRRKLRTQQKKADQRNELNASKLTAIQSQMNPHFIFNSLNSIQDLVLKGDVDNSYTFITKFSNLVRRTLSYSDKDFIEFEQEIKLIELYLSLEKLRFKDDISFEINTGEIDDILIPPMLIQPFIENALVHGLLHKEGLKKLALNFTLKDVLYCEIIDNGIGREKALEIKKRQRGGHESFAINAINKRFEILREHFSSEVGFEYEDLTDSTGIIGTKVTLKIPIQRSY